LPRWVAGVEPSEGFLQSAKGNLGGRADLLRGTATEIPLASSSVDSLVSGLVLNFIPDPHAALAEMVRVTRRGGVVGAYVWDYAGKMELIRFFWDAARAIDPNAASLDEGSRFPICDPEALTRLFVGAGLGQVEVTAIDLQTDFASFDDYWQPFLGGQGPAPAYLMSLGMDERARLRDHLRERLSVQKNESISLVARAWAVRSSIVK
jgi:SAM-dependent methyltransferase